ncbi:MAG: alanine racemase [Phycisphaerae bacterium]|nr:alanine racemase [Phycisphaerae bacterium]
MSTDDYFLVNPDDLQTPALLVFPAVIHRNVDRMSSLLGGLDRIRPHIKTHKCKQVIRLLMGRGVSRFKCALVSEARLLIESGARDIQLAYPLVGPAVDRLAELVAEAEGVAVQVTVDDIGSARALEEAFERHDRTIDVLIDLDAGMHRTGIAPGPGAEALARAITAMPHLRLRGFHAYDGHIRESDVDARRPLVAAAMAEPLRMKRWLDGEGLCEGPARLSTSGTLSFIVAKDIDEIDEVTPGTWVFWDGAYNEIDGARFEFGGLVASRVVCRPGGNRLTLDAGSKGVSRDLPGPPIVVNRPGLVLGPASEEHQTAEWIGEGSVPEIGEVILLAPRHICTTVYLYSHFQVVEGGRVVDRWPIECQHGEVYRGAKDRSDGGAGS